jgi:hypothetical protein
MHTGETWSLREPRGQELDRLDGRSNAALAQDRGVTKVVQGQWDFSADLCVRLARLDRVKVVDCQIFSLS